MNNLFTGAKISFSFQFGKRLYKRNRHIIGRHFSKNAITVNGIDFCDCEGFGASEHFNSLKVVRLSIVRHNNDLLLPDATEYLCGTETRTLLEAFQARPNEREGPNLATTAKLD